MRNRGRGVQSGRWNLASGRTRMRERAQRKLIIGGKRPLGRSLLGKDVSRVKRSSDW